MDRRKFIGAELGLTVPGVAAASGSPQDKGVMEIKIDIGNLPLDRARAHVERIRNNFFRSDRPAGWQFVFTPTRVGPSEVRVFVLADGSRREIEPWVTRLADVFESEAERKKRQMEKIEDLKLQVSLRRIHNI